MTHALRRSKVRREVIPHQVVPVSYYSPSHPLRVSSRRLLHIPRHTLRVATYVVVGVLGAGVLRGRLRGYKLIADGMTVVFDPPGASGDGELKSRYARPGKALYAALVHDGIAESRTRPPRSALAFEMKHLVPLVKKALEILPELGE